MQCWANVEDVDRRCINVVRVFCVDWVSGADPGFEKGGAQGVRPQDFFGLFRGLFKEFSTKRDGRAPPPPLLDPRLGIQQQDMRS